MNIERAIARTLLFALGAATSSATLCSAQTVTEIVDATGAGTGKSLFGPCCVAVDRAANVHVAGSSSLNTLRVSPTGTITETADLQSVFASGPHSLAVDSAGNLFVADPTRHSVFRVTPAGGITPIIDASGAGGSASLSFAEEVAVDDSGNVYVTGFNSSNAFKITPGGTITEIIDSTGDGAGNALLLAHDIAVGSGGNVYVTGWGSSNVFEITPGGAIVELIDAAGDGLGNVLDTPSGVAVDRSGNVYVSGYGSDNAFKITPASVITELIDASGDGNGSTLEEPWAVAVDDSANVYITGSRSDNAFKISGAGTITEILDASGDGNGNTLELPTGIAVFGSDTVYVTGDRSSNVFEIDLPIENWGVSLDVAQAGTPFPANGFASVAVNVGTGAIEVTGSYAGLAGSQSAAHLHGPAAIGTTAPIALTLAGGGGSSGSFSGFGTLSTTELADLAAGLYYVDVHSTIFPSGQIRGQVVQRTNVGYPPERVSDPELADGAGDPTLGPRIADASEPFDVTLDCSGSSAGGIYVLRVSVARRSTPQATSSGSLWLDGATLVQVVGAHTRNTVAFGETLLPPTPSLVGQSIVVQGYCGDSSPGVRGRTSNALAQWIGL